MREVNRYQAALVHLFISLVVFAILAWLVLVVWFPGFFYAIDGGWEGMRIIIAVDLVLGPMLTLIVFKVGKPGLKFDLTVIATMQILCLAGGVYVIYSERPTFFVYYERHFYSCSADTFSRYGVPAPNPQDFGDRYPAYVAAKLPESPIEEADFRRILYQDQIPVWVYPRSYVPLEESMNEMIEEGISEEELRERDVSGTLDPWVARHGGQVSDYAFFPVHSRYRDAFIGVRKADRSFIGIVEIAPPM